MDGQKRNVLKRKLLMIFLFCDRYFALQKSKGESGNKFLRGFVGTLQNLSSTRFFFFFFLFFLPILSIKIFSIPSFFYLILILWCCSPMVLLPSSCCLPPATYYCYFGILPLFFSTLDVMGIGFLSDKRPTGFCKSRSGNMPGGSLPLGTPWRLLNMTGGGLRTI